jgi:hypothetical protein
VTGTIADLLALGTLSDDKFLGTVSRRVRKDAKGDYNFRHICLFVCLSVRMEQLLHRRRTFVKFYDGEFFLNSAEEIQFG